LAQSLAEEQQIHPIYIFFKPKFPKFFWSKRQEIFSEKNHGKIIFIHKGSYADEQLAY
jgi:hypothetical protein